MQVDDDVHPLMMVGGEVQCDVFKDKRAMHSYQEPFGADGAGLVGVLFRRTTSLGMVDHPLFKKALKEKDLNSFSLSLFL